MLDRSTLYVTNAVRGCACGRSPGDTASCDLSRRLTSAATGTQDQHELFAPPARHVKWKARGKRRIHERPDVGEINACAPWLNREVVLVRLRVIVAMGATAVRALLGRAATISSLRSSEQTSRFGIPLVVTVHPSAIVRLRDPDERREALASLAADLRRRRRDSGPDLRRRPWSPESRGGEARSFCPRVGDLAAEHQIHRRGSRRQHHRAHG